MNLRPAAAEHAYAALKADMRRGRFPPGSALNVHTLALELGLSISPIRDAMGRLVGEHLVALRPEGGFLMPAITEDVVSDLYKWNARLLLMAIRERGEGVGQGEQPPGLMGDDHDSGAIANLTARLFREIASFSSSLELRRSVDAASDRLTSLRHRESILPDRLEELRRIMENLGAGHGRRLQNSIIRYHQLRLRRVGTIVAALYKES